MKAIAVPGQQNGLPSLLSGHFKASRPSAKRGWSLIRTPFGVAHYLQGSIFRMYLYLNERNAP